MKKGCTNFLLLLLLGLLWPADGFAMLGSGKLGVQLRLRQAGDLVSIYRAIEHQISPCPESAVLPVVKEDAAGRIWTAWEEWANGRTRIGVGFLKDDGILARQLVSNPQGSDFSPDLALDSGGSPWAAWASYSALGYRIRVQDLASQRNWSLRPGPKSTVTDPKIVIAENGKIRVFWNETRENSWRIVVRTFDGYRWSPANEVLRESSVPTVNPDVVRSGHDSTWLTWSAYDGQDFEVYLSLWDGGTLSAPIQLTNNGENDLFPTLGLGQNGFPVVSWMRPSREGNRVFATRLEGNIPGPEAPLSPPVRDLVLPRMASVAGKAVALWNSAAGLGAGEVESVPITPIPPGGGPGFEPPSIFNPNRDENSYIGFGDSITYGYIDRLPTPDLGYPPRLDIILNQNFGPTEMINEGVGGENTLMGAVRIRTVLDTRPGRYFLIMEGTNDVINLPVSIDTSVFCLREIIQKVRAAGAFPTLTTILPRRDWAWPNPQVRTRHRYLNDQIRILQAELRVSFIDMDKLFLDYPAADGGMLSLLSNDRKHPSEKGYQFMAQKFFEEIRNYPFPPVNAELKGVMPDTDLSGMRPGRPVHRPTGFNTAPDQGPGNLLVWKTNPKTYDSARIKGYRIYRKLKSIPKGEFRLVAFVEDALDFFDGGRWTLDRFVYLVSALRDDEVEGPCAGPIDE